MPVDEDPGDEGRGGERPRACERLIDAKRSPLGSVMRDESHLNLLSWNVVLLGGQGGELGGDIEHVPRTEVGRQPNAGEDGFQQRRDRAEPRLAP